MEDYQAAFIQRHVDTETLCKSTRKIAAMHFGGVTIECLLKSRKTDSNSPGHTITNPGHSYIEALKRHNRLQSRVQKFPEVRNGLMRLRIQANISSIYAILAVSLMMRVTNAG